MQRYKLCLTSMVATEEHGEKYYSVANRPISFNNTDFVQSSIINNFVQIVLT